VILAFAAERIVFVKPRKTKPLWVIALAMAAVASDALAEPETRPGKAVASAVHGEVSVSAEAGLTRAKLKPRTELAEGARIKTGDRVQPSKHAQSHPGPIRNPQCARISP